MVNRVTTDDGLTLPLIGEHHSNSLNIRPSTFASTSPPLNQLPLSPPSFLCCTCNAGHTSSTTNVLLLVLGILNIASTKHPEHTLSITGSHFFQPCRSVELQGRKLQRHHVHARDKQSPRQTVRRSRPCKLALVLSFFLSKQALTSIGSDTMPPTRLSYLFLQRFARRSFST